jgi:glycosyltransferase involved in cell wall biosynthesis
MKHGCDIVIVYYGADGTWDTLRKEGFYRRNTYLLREFSRHPAVKRLIVVSHTDRITSLCSWSWWKTLLGLGQTDKVQDLHVFAVIPGEQYLNAIKRLNRSLTAWITRRMLRVSTKPKLIHWCYWPGGLELRETLNISGSLVFDTDHDILHDDNKSAGEASDLEPWMQLATEKADIIVSSSRTMLEWFSKRGARRCERLRNGVDAAAFSQEVHRVTSVVRLRVGYLGVLSRWVDFGLLLELARARPDWEFVIGGYFYLTETPKEFESRSNVKFIGPYTPKEAKGILASFDIALSLYVPGGSDVDSMKIYEYLAAGIPVVATPLHDGMKADFNDLIKICSTSDDFIDAIESIVNWDEADLLNWDARRQAFICNNTWSERVNQALEWLHDEPN